MLAGADAFTYAAITILSVAISFGVLAVTKIPGVVVLCASILTTVLYLVYVRVTGAGYWDTLAVIALFTVLVFASIISLAFVGVGRLMRWSLFVEESREQ